MNAVNRSICLNGGYLGNPSCTGISQAACFSEFVAVTEAEVRAKVAAHVLPVVQEQSGNASATDQLIVLDLEDSVRPDLFWSFPDSDL